MRPLYHSLLLVIEILHYLNDPKIWEIWYIPYHGSYRNFIITHYVP